MGTLSPDGLRIACLQLVVLLCAACETSQDGVEPHVSAEGGSTISEIVFVDVAAEAGLRFRHENGATGRFYYPELMQGGAGLLDYDGDGLLDVYLVQSGPLPATGSEEAANRLYRNLGDGSFQDVGESAGVGDRGYGSGVAAADYDGDGRIDLYVTNLGPNRLYRNLGGGRFEDATDAAGVGDPRYSTSAAFLDYDRDGDLDLYVCNYVEWSPRVEQPCLGPMGLRGYCNPGEYDPQPDSLYRNEGDGRFVDVSEPSGIAARASTGLGVAVADFDADGWPDLYVANDQRPNFLWRNTGEGSFREEALVRGCALNALGQPEAGMGVVASDPDHDGDWDLFVVHLSGETNTFYRNLGEGLFVDVTDELDLGAVSRPYTGFGTDLFDADNDGALDVFIANGKVSPGDSVEPDYREPNQLLAGRRDGVFVDVSRDAGSALSLFEVSRAAAFGDVDNDGDVDILVANNDGPARLLRNESPSLGHWLSVALAGPGANRFGLGSEVRLTAGGVTQARLVQPARSYCAANDWRVHFGLGDEERVERLEVLWPDGSLQSLENVAVDRLLVVEHPASASFGGEED